MNFYICRYPCYDPFTFASSSSDLYMIPARQEEGADANAKDGKGNSALILASEKGHTGLVQYLLTNKADVEAKQKDGWASLHFASQKGHVKVAELLVVRDEGQGRGKCLYMQDQGRCGGGRMSVIDLYLHRHLYGSMCRCLFIYIYI